MREFPRGTVGCESLSSISPIIFSFSPWPSFYSPQMDDYTLPIPLLTTATATTTSGAAKEDAKNRVPSPSTPGPDVICRLLLVILIGTISVWANHEASKGFKVTIINNSAFKVSPAARRFHLFYVSNDEATRIILNTSAYPNHPHLTKKPVHHVVLQLAAGEEDKPSTTKVSVARSKGKESVYVINLSPTIME
ncbi:uncharacterized protein LOC120195679 [Hibiscus syriacus]|uniref:uncharacterized protein LOC120195679 n=1 Tax=Hibiscus syriacus TaxID=106335 RepID=UPI001921C52C|nr:uncharacterized protein LOC120195679 [Hibiscus syriacus]